MSSSKSSNKSKHITLRVSEETETFLNTLSEEWDMDRSEVIRTIFKGFNGLLYGNFLALLDEDRLEGNWGEIGELFKALKHNPTSNLDKATLSDVVKDLPVLVRATEVELGDGLD